MHFFFSHRMFSLEFPCLKKMKRLMPRSQKTNVGWIWHVTKDDINISVIRQVWIGGVDVCKVVPNGAGIIDGEIPINDTSATSTLGWSLGNVISTGMQASGKSAGVFLWENGVCTALWNPFYIFLNSVLFFLNSFFSVHFFLYSIFWGLLFNGQN